MDVFVFVYGISLPTTVRLVIFLFHLASCMTLYDPLEESDLGSENSIWDQAIDDI